MPAVESDAAVEDVDDQRETGERERKREPDPAPDGLVEGKPRPEGDEQRRQVFDQERDSDLEPVDREEVEPLDEGKPADPEQRKAGQLATPDAEARRGGREKHEHEPDECARRAHLGEAQRRDPGGEDHLRDGAVDPPERRGASPPSRTRPAAAAAAPAQQEKGPRSRRPAYAGCRGSRALHFAPNGM